MTDISKTIESAAVGADLAPNATTGPKSTEKRVKILVLRPILLDRKKVRGRIEGRIVNPGTPAAPVHEMVSEEDAKLFCDTAFHGHYNYWGNRTGDENKHPCFRAKRV